MNHNDDDEVARYLSSPPEPTQDALAWWTERRGSYPKLARMALDYLSIPGMWAPPEGALLRELTTSISQLPPSMLNVRSAGDAGCSLTSVAGSAHSRRAPSSASATGSAGTW